MALTVFSTASLEIYWVFMFNWVLKLVGFIWPQKNVNIDTPYESGLNRSYRGPQSNVRRL